MFQETSCVKNVETKTTEQRRKSSRSVETTNKRLEKLQRHFAICRTESLKIDQKIVRLGKKTWISSNDDE